MTLKTNCTPTNNRDERPLCATAAITLDLKPVVQAITSVSSDMREENAASRKRVGELAMIISSMGSDIAQNAKLLLGIQGCLQSLEDEQRKMTDQSIRVRFLQPLARKLLGLRASADKLMENEEDFDYIANAIDDVLGDFNIDLLEPKVGEPFDAKFMKPRAENAGRKSLDLLVREVILPGAMYKDHLLEFCQVKLIDRVSYLALHEREEGSPFPHLSA